MRAPIFIFLFFLFSLCKGNIYAQELSTCLTEEKSDEEMKKLPWYGNSNELEKARNARFSILLKENSLNKSLSCSDLEYPMSIPIRFWIYLYDSNDTGAPTEAELSIMMDGLNEIFANANTDFRFNSVCPQIEINPDLADASDFDLWQSQVGGSGDLFAIDVHIVDVLDNGFASGTYYSFGDFIAVTRDVYENPNNVSTLAHEIGHYFTLEHTHRNYDANVCKREAVSRTRTFSFFQGWQGGGFPVVPFPINWCWGKGLICRQTADGFCDTEADPRLSNKVNSNCEYTSSDIDSYGDAYAPDEENVMSYSLRSCRSMFSEQQVDAMWNNLLWGAFRDFIYFLDQNLVDPDKYEPDNSDEVGVPRIINLGESQCHSSHEISECPDPADWLRIDVSNSAILGKYEINVNDLSGYDYPVDDIKVWKTNVFGENT